MKTTLLTVCALVALASFANAQTQTPTADPHKGAPAAQAPATSGTSNSGDVDRSVPQNDHGTQKTPAQSNGSADPSSNTSDNGASKPSKGDTTEKDHSKATDRDHGVDKTTHQDPKDGTDPTKDARTEDKSKNDKITDHEHGAEKTKN